jgi:hypothetical protein
MLHPLGTLIIVLATLECVTLKKSVYQEKDDRNELFKQNITDASSLVQQAD